MPTMHMYDEYQEFYKMSAQNDVFSKYCREVFGEDFAQDGFSDIDQINDLIAKSGIKNDSVALDIGCGNGGLFWLSYPKSVGKQKNDLNRGSLWDAVLPHGWHPVSQVSLNEKWSAIRLKRNEPGVVYEQPVNKREMQRK